MGGKGGGGGGGGGGDPWGGWDGNPDTAPSSRQDSAEGSKPGDYARSQWLAQHPDDARYKPKKPEQAPFVGAPKGTVTPDTTAAPTTGSDATGGSSTTTGDVAASTVTAPESWMGDQASTQAPIVGSKSKLKITGDTTTSGSV